MKKTLPVFIILMLSAVTLFADEATDVQKKLSASDEVTILGLLDSIHVNYKDFLNEKEAATWNLTTPLKVTTPQDFIKTLEEINERIINETKAAQMIKADAEQSQAEKQQKIEKGIQAGEALFSEGKQDEAMQAWRSIVPLFKDGARIQMQLDDMEKNRRELLNVKPEAAKAIEEKDKKPSVPEQFLVFLEEEKRKQDQEIKASKDAEIQAQEIQAKRQQLIESGMSDGMHFFSKGDYENAIKTWDSLAPFYSDGDKVHQMLNQLKVSYLKYLEAQQAANEKLKKSEEKRASSVELQRLIENARNQIQMQTILTSKAPMPELKPVSKTPSVPVDEIDQMILEYHLATVEEVEQRYEERKRANAEPSLRSGKK
jgi:hypothetical protein